MRGQSSMNTAAGRVATALCAYSAPVTHYKGENAPTQASLTALSSDRSFPRLTLTQLTDTDERR